MTPNKKMFLAFCGQVFHKWLLNNMTSIRSQKIRWKTLLNISNNQDEILITITIYWVKTSMHGSYSNTNLLKKQLILEDTVFQNLSIRSLGWPTKILLHLKWFLNKLLSLIKRMIRRKIITSIILEMVSSKTFTS